MMLDAPTRAVYRAEEQMESGAWKIPDSDEHDLATCCHVCAEPLVPVKINLPSGRIAWRKPLAGTRVCPACVRIGWRTAACVVCGGVTRTWDWPSKRRNKSHRGYCKPCREAVAAEKEMLG